MAVDLSRDLDDLGKLLRVEARPADQDTVAKRQLDVLLILVGEQSKRLLSLQARVELSGRSP